jgi:hypothetical protein
VSSASDACDVGRGAEHRHPDDRRHDEIPSPVLPENGLPLLGAKKMAKRRDRFRPLREKGASPRRVRQPARVRVY